MLTFGSYLFVLHRYYYYYDDTIKFYLILNFLLLLKLRGMFLEKLIWMYLGRLVGCLFVRLARVDPWKAVTLGKGGTTYAELMLFNSHSKSMRGNSLVESRKTK